MFKANLDKIRKHSPDVFKNILLYPQEAEKIIIENKLDVISVILRKYIDQKLGKMIDGESDRVQRKRALANKLFAVLYKYEKRPLKIFELLTKIEIKRTGNIRSNKTASFYTPFSPAAVFPTALGIMNELFKRVTLSDKAAKFWCNWLDREFIYLDKRGPRSYAGLGIKQKEATIYELPTSYWQAVRAGKYKRSPNFMRVSKYDMVRQQKHILTSIINYGWQINKIIDYLKEIKGRDNLDKKEIRQFIKKIKKYEKELTIAYEELKIKSKNKMIDLLVQLNLPNKDYGIVRKKINIVLRYLQQRHNNLASQYKQISRKRKIIAVIQLKDIELELQKTKIISREMNKDAREVIAGVLSGFLPTINKRILDKDFAMLAEPVKIFFKLTPKILTLRPDVYKIFQNKKSRVNFKRYLIANNIFFTEEDENRLFIVLTDMMKQENTFPKNKKEIRENLRKIYNLFFGKEINKKNIIDEIFKTLKVFGV